MAWFLASRFSRSLKVDYPPIFIRSTFPTSCQFLSWMIEELKGSTKTLQAVPWRGNRFSQPRIGKAYFLQGAVGPTIVARGTGDDHVFQVAGSSPRVRQQMVVLRPHRLERRMLRFVGASPLECMGIGILNSVPSLGPDYRDSAKPAMITISDKQ